MTIPKIQLAASFCGAFGTMALAHANVAYALLPLVAAGLVCLALEVVR